MRDFETGSGTFVLEMAQLPGTMDENTARSFATRTVVGKPELPESRD
jgi:hypothetical protein